MKKYSKLISCIILIIIFIFITFILKKYFKPFLWILVIYFLSNPIFKILSKNNIFNDKINAMTSILLVNIITIILLSLLWMYIFNNFLYFDQNSIFFKQNEVLKKFNDILNLKIILDKAQYFFNNLNSHEIIKKGAFYTSEELLAFFIANIIVYFIISDKKRIVDITKQLITDKNTNFLISKLKVISQIIRFEMIFVGITTLETIIGFKILNISHGVFLGLICGLLDIIPYIGTILIFIPLIYSKIYSKNYFVALGLICLYIFLVINRQYMETKYMSHKIQVHPLLIIISFYIGVKYFGIIGLFMGPICILTIKEFVFQKEIS